jgi:hypothetical protein
MEISTIIVDNFLDNPDSVRESALASNINITGDFPGFRSNPSSQDYSNYAKEKIEKILNLKIIEWESCFNTVTKCDEVQGTTRFQLCLEGTKTWIHSDPTEWTGILYLTPNAPVDSGTAVYRHKKTKIYIHTDENPANDSNVYEAWEIIAFVGNLYNRLAIIKGHMYHRSLVSGFGHDKYSGRLTQTFFFSTTPKDRS